ncbi:MAG TPA: DUF1549 domain-containing protein, partial [Pirellulaceae bacterium]|nr:DUF1549 domain-containing protein [Pirellulaceae bacterium]
MRAAVPWAGAGQASPGRIDDERFLRRATLDIIGRLPTPEETTAFSLDPSSDKRAKIALKLLAQAEFGENWGRYWRDVIMYRKTEDRSGIINGPLTTYLTESFNTDKPWSQIATEFITAEGDATENGACGLIVAQQGNPEEVTSEVSRIFLGVQISCAQCHNHPTDRWKREQFHELAAFFPRVSSRIILNNQETGPQVIVSANDMAFGGRFRAPMNMRRFGTPEHYMSDLKNPQSRGTLMTPVLFATGQKLPLGTKDADRRGTLAQWITAKDNPYFAQAFVNRMWSELTGEGFYEPVDDMGPDRTAVAPQTLEYLAKEFAESDYNVKWLFQTIMATDLYQTPSAPRRGPEDPPMQHNVAQRLRADVLFDNLLVALEASEPRGFGGGRGGLYGFGGGPRGQFAAAFGYDPSQRRDEIQSSIPQALAMMNSPTIAGSLRGTGNTLLARLLR